MRIRGTAVFLLIAWIAGTAGTRAFARAAAREPVPAHEVADRLVEDLGRAGLERVRAVRRGGRTRVEGVLPGKVPEEIVLSARYGSDSGSAGVAVAAAAELRRTPLRHTVRVVLFDDRGRGSDGGRRWLMDLGLEGRRRILAALHLEKLVGSDGAGPVILSFPARTAEGGPVQAPGWLVHAVLKSGEAVGFPYAVADWRLPVLAQLVLRGSAVLRESGSEPFLELGVPSVALSESSFLVPDLASSGKARAAARLDARGLDRWTEAVAAAVRRLDALGGRPVWEDRYLAAFGRVWLRRDLLWAGFLPWALLVFRGRPGRWRGGSAEEHGRQMRVYLPGFLFRGSLLLAVFLAPVFSVLLLPAATLALVPPRPPWARALWIVIGFLPLLVFLAALTAVTVRGSAGLGSIGPAASVLIPVALLSYAWTIGRRPVRGARPLTEDHPPGKVEV